MVNTSSYYVIVPTEDVTIKMINLSTSNSTEDLRKNNNGTKSVIRVSAPVHEVFLDYILYTKDEILEELQNEEWIQNG